MSNIPQLSAYQYGLLTHTASATVPIFLLPKPLQTDIPSQRFKLKARQNEILSLVAMGLVEDASDEFRDSIREQHEATGRKYKVYGLTEVGYHLFHGHGQRSVN